MHRERRAAIVVLGCLLITAALRIHAFAQASFATTYQTTDFSGEWWAVGGDVPFAGRMPFEVGYTAELHDYSGLPFNDAGRARADAGDISDWSIPEFVCRPHPGPYNWFYGGGFRITKDIDPITRELVAYHVQFLRSVDRPIYMDGRPHPPEWAPHTWSGFSTGKYDGNILVVTTTHIRESYIRANTALFSEKAKFTEYLMLDGDLLTVTTLLEDPVYMEEPHLQSISFRRDLHQELPSFPCTVNVENVTPGFPHFLPGRNPYIDDTAKKLGLPRDALRGGAETLYPEYRKKLKTLPGPSLTVRTDAQQGQGPFDVAQGRPPAVPPKAAAAAAIDLTGTWVSVINEDWWLRMVTPRKGDYTHLSLTPAARKVADAWDPAKDVAAGEQCKGYGAAAITRLPGRLRISWQDENTMKVEYEAGNQTRLFRFGAPPPAAPPSWQGVSVAEWKYTAVPPRSGELKVVTNRLRAGYLRKNGVPYSANTTMTEYYHRMTAPNGDSWLTIVSEVTDPENLPTPFVLSTHFKKLPDGAAFTPEPCSAS